MWYISSNILLIQYLNFQGKKISCKVILISVSLSIVETNLKHAQRMQQCAGRHNLIGTIQSIWLVKKLKILKGDKVRR